ncbi:MULTISPECIES: hypothetical protein [unclassified Mesorhizobium]|uniref:hypothetical protein n=1 Tax=unclassified Mesorhizobium TaxID=325217 RepID=UPI000FCAC4D2|nr:MULTISPECIES: hypothetical protein [unclassified Mesorhizobium]RUV36095.1 hypothetical protein EOB49_18140 [Mesorhizobium sp. M7A.F.Ca.MR.148.00.0.0]RWN23709.1 MAG: hypothetical protein EOR94_01775 [Mesorhizobium sp.]RWN43786.1 MAG: hypothetical protein EOS03_24350 [Mesorhizobium sp.]
MARVDIVRVDTPEGNAVRAGEPITVSVTVSPDRGWFNDTEYLVIDFIYADTSDIASCLLINGNDTNIEDTTTINFKLKAESGALTGEYYVRITNNYFEETIVSGPEDGTITVSSS